MSDLFHTLPPHVQKALLNGPAIPPPPGVVPNFENPPNRRHIGWIVVCLAASLSTAAVIARLYSRFRISKTVLIEDYLTMAAFGAYIAFQTFVFRIVVYPGFYVHMWDIQLKNLSGFLYDLFTGATIHGIVIMLLKAAILMDLIRLFSPRGQRGLLFWTAHILIWVNVVFYTTCTFLELFGCQPREKLWNKLLPGGHCINQNILTLASSAVNLPSDLVILVLPHRVIWNLQMSTKRKIKVSSVFAVAIFACVAAAMRLRYSVPLLNTKDILYVVADAGVWMQAEMAAGFLILGIPALPKIFKSSPVLQKFVVIVKSWTGSISDKAKSESRKGLPSWYKPPSRKRHAEEEGWSELEITQGTSFVLSDDKNPSEVDIKDSPFSSGPALGVVPPAKIIFTGGK